MIDLKFPDGAVRQYPEGATGYDVAQSIAPSLAKRAALVKLDGELRDVHRPLDRGGAFEIVTRDTPEAQETIRHDTALVRAGAGRGRGPGARGAGGPAGGGGGGGGGARGGPGS